MRSCVLHAYPSCTHDILTITLAFRWKRSALYKSAYSAYGLSLIEGLHAHDFASFLGFLYVQCGMEKHNKHAIILDSLQNRILNFTRVCVLMFSSPSCNLVFMIWTKWKVLGHFVVFSNTRLWGKETNMAVSSFLLCLWICLVLSCLCPCPCLFFGGGVS